MKKIIVFFTAIMILGSCSDFLDPKLTNERPYEQMVTQPSMIQGLVYFAYRSIPNTFDNNLTYLSSTEYLYDFLDCATDNAATNNYSGGIYKMAEISNYWNPSRNPLDAWGSRYEEIQSINKFFDVMEDLTWDFVFTKSDLRNDSILKRTLQGEAYFLRAWCHFDLLRRYGGLDENNDMMGVPVVHDWLTIEEFEALDRNTYAETVEAIAKDLDSALIYLPDEWQNLDADADDYKSLAKGTQLGRPTTVACHALKSRMYLYAASDAFTEGVDASIVTDYNTKCADASIDAINILGLGLDDIYWRSSFDVSANFFNAPNIDELILRRITSNSGILDIDLEQRNYIPSLYGQGTCSPSQNLVDAFPMADGYPIDHATKSTYDASDMYANRDLRFYQTVLYNGASFNGVTVDTYVGGKDAISGSDLANVNTSTRTGYYLRKWLSNTVSLASGAEIYDTHYAALFRKVELYLNMAEALNSLGGPDYSYRSNNARDAMEEIWCRANFKGTATPYIAELTTKADFFEYIKNERRIELCFEGGHRFYDLRRWKEPLKTDVKGIVIPTDGSDTTITTVYTTAFNDGDYYSPIPENQIAIMPKVTQNKGW